MELEDFVARGQRAQAAVDELTVTAESTDRTRTQKLLKREVLPLADGGFEQTRTWTFTCEDGDVADQDGVIRGHFVRLNLPGDQPVVQAFLARLKNAGIAFEELG